MCYLLYLIFWCDRRCDGCDGKFGNFVETRHTHGVELKALAKSSDCQISGRCFCKQSTGRATAHRHSAAGRPQKSNSYGLPWIWRGALLGPYYVALPPTFGPPSPYCFGAFFSSISSPEERGGGGRDLAKFASRDGPAATRVQVIRRMRWFTSSISVVAQAHCTGLRFQTFSLPRDAAIQFCCSSNDFF